MRPVILTLFVVLCATLASGQINNEGFEKGRDTAATLPASWGFKKVPGFDFTLDSQVKQSGEKSLLITGNGDGKGFAPFSQVVPVNFPTIKHMAISVWIKTRDAKGDGAGLWCQVWDKDKKQIGFKNLELQGTQIKGNTEWNKYTLKLIVNANCKYLLLGGYLHGTGSAWYDNFSLEEGGANAGTPPSKEVKRYLSKFCRIIKENSIYSSGINWDSLDNEVANLSLGATTNADAAEVGAYVLSKLRALGDNHSFIMSQERSEQAAKENVDGRQPSAHMLSDSIGYLYVPGIFSTNDTAIHSFALNLQGLIKELDTKHQVSSWVVDLRQNTGGNMYPMIAGLGPLLENGNLGYFVSSDKSQPWYYKNGRCGMGKSALVKIEDYYTLRKPHPKIAVLISGNTASSGEMTTISFIGNPRTKLFGEESAGYTTANGMFSLPDHSTMMLASSYCADRNNRKYMGKITPNVAVVEGADALAIAEQWLKGNE